MNKITRIGFVGIGVMGGPICRHLATKSGLEVRAHDPDLAALERLGKFGVRSATLDDIAQSSDAIFLSLPSGEVVEKVIFGEGGLLNRMSGGQVLIDLSTSPYDTTMKLAATLAERGIRFLDAPVMRTRVAAEEGTLAVPVGADEDAFALMAPFLGMFASDVMHMGKAGSGQIVKILNNMVVYETVLALAEARAIGVRVGMDPDTLFAALAAGSADSFALRNHGMKAIAHQEFPEKAFPVTYARKDLAYALMMAEEVGINATGAKNLLNCFDEAIQHGWGEKYAPAISLVLERGEHSLSNPRSEQPE